MSNQDPKNHQLISDVLTALKTLYYNASDRPEVDVFTLVQRCEKALRS